MKTLAKRLLFVFILSACSTPASPATPEPETGTYYYQDFAYDIVWSQDESMIGVTTVTGFYIYDTKTNEQLFDFQENGGTGAVFGKSIAAAFGNEGVWVWNLKDFKQIFHVPSDEPAQFQAIAISPDEKTLVTGENNRIRVWSIPDGVSIGDVKLDGFPSDIKFRNNESIIIADSYFGNVYKWDVRKFKTIREFSFEKSVVSLRLSADASLVLVDYGLTGFELWDVASEKLKHGYGDIASASGWQRMSGDNHYVVVWGFAFDGQNSGMSVWDLEVHTNIQQFRTPFVNGDGWRCGALNSNGSILAASNNEGYIKFFDVVTGQEKGQIYLPYKFAVEKG